MAGTPLWYLATDQWRYESFDAGELASPAGRGLLARRALADCNALAVRLGWLPSHPAFDRNPLDLADEVAAAGQDAAGYVVSQLRSGRLRFAAEDPDDPACWPRVLLVWRANLFASSMKGHEYLLKHLLGTDHAVTAAESPPGSRPAEVTWREDAPRGKLDLSVAADFRMTSTCLYSDIVLPAATWYEKHDLSSTDMHPFVHSFNPAIAPPWETRTDFDIFHTIAAEFSRLAAAHLGVRRDVVAAPLAHDTPDELAQPGGRVRDWKAGECDPVPGKTMPRLITVERRLAVMRAHMRARQLADEPDPSLAATAGMDPAAVDDLYRLLAIAKYDERYVIPQTHNEGAGRLMSQHCSLGYPGGGADYGEHTADTLAEHFHLTAGGPPAAGSGSTFADSDGRARFNLLGWNGTGPAPGLFPEAGPR